jgi:hypothetical protein
MACNGTALLYFNTWVHNIAGSTQRQTENKPERLRLVGTPRKRWLDEVEQNLKQMGVRGWRRGAQNRDEWQSILKEAKVLHRP